MIKSLFRFAILAFSLMIITGPTHAAKRTITIGYFEAGDYFVHKVLMNELRRHLEKLSNDEYEFVFDPYAYKSAEWNHNLTRAMAGDLVRNKDLDLVITAGPWVTNDLIEAGFNKPIIAVNQLFPQLSGLVDNTGRTVYRNLTLTYDPDKLESDFKELGQLFPEKRCGFLYFPEKDEFAAATETAGRFAENNNIELVPAEGYGQSGMYSFFIAFEKIRENIDVVYLPSLWGMDLEMLREFFTQIHFNKIPTFAAEGYLLIEKGAMASNCDRPYLSEARIAAYKIQKIVAGATPGDLPTGYPESAILCLNSNEAAKMNLQFSRRLIRNAKLLPEIPDESIEQYNLKRLIDQALVENADYQTELLTYNRAIEEAGKAYSEFRPNIRGRAGIAATGDNAEAAHYNNVLQKKYFAEVEAEQKIFSYSAIKAVQAAKKRQAISKLDAKEAENRLRETVMAAFISCLTNEDKVAQINNIINSLRDNREMARTDYALQVTPDNFISLYDEQIIASRIELIKYQRELAVSRAVLNCLINRPPDFQFRLDRTGFDNESMVRLIRGLEYYSTDANIDKKLRRYFVETGTEKSLGLASADLTIGLHRDLLKQHKGRYFPELSLRAKYEVSSEFDPGFSTKDGNWTIGGLVRFPVYLGGSRGQTGKALRTRYEESLYNKDALRLKLVGEITTKFENLYMYIEAVPLYYDLRNTSLSIFENERDKYATDRISYERLLQYEESLSKNELELIEDKYWFFKAYLDLLDVVGVGYLEPMSDEERVFYEGIAEYLSNH